MTTRRKFIANSTGTLMGIALGSKIISAGESFSSSDIITNASFPIVVSTWNFGLAANEAAWKILTSGGYALDAVEAGVKIPEGDPEIMSVGYGGLPDREGKVTLDACIMDEKGNAGSVVCLENIKHPISVARMVMEKTPHVILSGGGALKFALENGFHRENLLTPKAKKAWKNWKKSGEGFKPIINIEKEVNKNHDTIGMVAIDQDGRMCGACTTSGMAFKMSGRVGDSPIIGAGLFVDGKVGGAVATGTGELVLKTLGSFLVVELMRNGHSPGMACKEAVNRIVEMIPGYRLHQIGYLAINKSGETGAYSLQPGFEVAVRNQSGPALLKATSLL
jgi:N4-(beta-N-acetylglucosaminyl)-L-asparaginase